MGVFERISGTLLSLFSVGPKSTPGLAVNLGAAPGTPPYNPVWFGLTDIYWDPGNSSTLASDSNDGQSTTTPILTWAELVRRYGSSSPTMNYAQTTTVHLMSVQPAGQDPAFLHPHMSGGADYLMDGNLGMTNPGAAFTIGVGDLSGGFGFAGATPTAGGTQMVLAGVPAYVTQGCLLENTTRGSYAFVDSVSAGNASLTQPQTKTSLTTFAGGFPLPVVDNDWASGDSVTVWTLPSVNVKSWASFGSGDANSGTPSGMVLLRLTIGGGVGMHGWTSVHAWSCVQLTAGATLGPSSGSGYIMGCLMLGAIDASVGTVTMFGGSCRGASTWVIGNSVGNSASNWNNNACLHGTVTVAGNLSVGPSFHDGSIIVAEQSSVRQLATLFGSFALTVTSGATWLNQTGSTYALTLLTSGALKLGGATTGTSYAGGVWTDGVTITTAHLDANNGLQNPRSGARFTNGT